MVLKDLCRGIINIASEVSEYIRNESIHFDLTKLETKGMHDFVSYVDKGAEQMIVEKLGLLLPQAGFIAEEETSSIIGERYQWIIDPLDGTTNFVHKIHPHAISIALKDFDEIVAGVVYEIDGKEIFVAWKNGGAWLNGVRIHVSKTGILSNSLIATGYPYRDFSLIENYINCFRYFIINCSGVRRMGCASIDLAYIACGRFDGFFEYALKPWDIAAGILLIREAGGFASDFSGREDDLTGTEIIAANNLIFPEILNIIRNFMS